MSAKVRLVDIANALSLSIGTVDRALHNRPEIKRETRELVHAKAREMGYRKNDAASSLSRRSLRLVAALPKGDGFFSQLGTGIRKSAEDLAEFKVSTVLREYGPFPDGNEDELSVLESIVQGGCDGLIFCPSNRPEVLDAMKRVMDRNIPIITVASDAPRNLRNGSVTSDGFAAGRIAADILGPMLGQGGKIAVFPGFLTTQDHNDKMAGFKRTVLDDFPDLEIIGAYETSDMDRNSYRLSLDLMQEQPDLAGIYVASATGYGVARAVSEAGKRGKIKVIATDILETFVPYLESGVITATLWQNPVRQGQLSLKMLYSLINGESLPLYDQTVYPVVVTKHNYRHYLDEQAY